MVNGVGNTPQVTSPEKMYKKHAQSHGGHAVPAVLQASVSGRVASVVNTFEAASLSASTGQHKNLPQYRAAPTHYAARAPPSPIKTSFNPAPTTTVQTKSNPISPTVPASFFQQQQAKRTPPASPAAARVQQQQQHQPTTPRSDKENRAAKGSALDDTPRSASYPSPSAFPAPPTSRPAAFSPGRPIRRDVDEAQSEPAGAQSIVSVETMATRSSNSTHANSLITVVDLTPTPRTREPSQFDDSTRRTARSQAPPQRNVQADLAIAHRPGDRGIRQSPQVVASPPLVPMPSFEARVKDREATRRHQPVSQERAQHSSSTRAHSSSSSSKDISPPERPKSAFSEALPSSSASSTAPMSSGRSQDDHDFIRLPLSHQQAPSGSGCGTRPATGRRQRASTIGATASTSPVEAPESFEEKQRRVNEAFGRLLDTMQLPDLTVRSKMLGLALPLKEEMLRSAAASSSTTSPTLRTSARPTHSRGRSLNIEANNVPIQRAPVPIDTGDKKDSDHGSVRASFLRKAKSTNSLRAASATQSSSGTSIKQAKRPSHSRATSASSLFRSIGRATGSSSSSYAATREREQSIDDEDATYWAVRIRSAGCAVLEVKEVGRLRGRLRAEPPSWVREFLRHGGYEGLLERLKELLDVEWREEQHDDQILYEVLRCIKALALTVCGSQALASRCPTPFLPLAALLFSEKRPGDLPCRQLLVEIIQSLFEICPDSAEPIQRTFAAWSTGAIVQLETDPSGPNGESNNSGGVRRYVRKVKRGDDDVDTDERGERREVISAERRRKAHVFVHSLMQGPVSEKDEARLDFIQNTHRNRRFKLWVTELADTVRDYFWIFCHSQNLFWSLNQLNVDEIEAPKVPSGMTGGVEYEAMCYAASHFRLINAIARTCSSVEEAFTFHNDLFESGLERVLLTLRRASLVYYQQLHLEMSRYLALARAARFNLGPRILSCLDARTLSPEERMVVEMAQGRVIAAPSSSSGAPQLGAMSFA